MNRPAVTHIANDNAPAASRPRGDAAGFRSMLREKDMERRLHKLELQQLMQNGQSMNAHSLNIQGTASPAPAHSSMPWALGAALFCTLCAAIAAAWCFYSGESLALRFITLIALVWSALWVTFLASENIETQDTGRKASHILPGFSTIIATIAGLGIWVLASAEWGLPLSVSDGVAGFAGLSLVTASVLRSRVSLLMSAIAGLVWLTIYTQIPSVNIISIWMYPLLAVLQLFLAGQQDTKLPAFISLLGAYGWLFWILNDSMMSGEISLLHVAAISLMIGFAHYRLGKAAGDRLWESATLHVVFGWGLAMAGAAGLQLYWLNPNAALWQDLTAQPLGQFTWQIIGAVCIALIGVAGLLRMAHRQMSTLAVLFSLVVAVGAAALFDQRAAITNFLQTQMNLPASPLVGLMIGAAILSSALAMCLNGARRKSNLMMLTSLAVIALELALLLKPEHWNPETGLAFAMAAIGSLSLAGLFAAESTTQPA